ncbi:uncharacterized protein CEXT_480221 [Caerostris extrusa]|uniref:Uncharacterized protein n=1 Tax=Caerostris extrusa TaxID=172846 RepID=A0AAV4NYU5_CAEEX|nr:uncharacterized protein CEXT_480221 [Caerostris extrusa]
MIPPASWKSLLWVFGGTSLVTLLFMHQITQTAKPIFIEKNEFLYYDLNKEEPIVPDQKCQLPRIHPFDQSILNYLTLPKAIVCKERIATLTFIDGEEYGDPHRIPINGTKLFSDFVYVSCYNFAGLAFYTNRMTKIGDNTFPNLGAILTGKSVFGNELPKIEDPAGTYDGWPCLWKNFSKSGYATLFAEDRPDIAIDNLRINQGRLTTPYDIHFTAIDIIKSIANNVNLGTETLARGTSLFGFISPNRTCSDAGIPDHYCVCETEKQLTVSDPKSQKAATALVTIINNLLLSHANFCSELTLVEVLRVDLIVPRREVIVNSRLYFGKHVEDGKASGMITKLRVIVKTEPGLGLFEGTLLLREDVEDISVLGDISRINRYGLQSSCIEDPIIRKYCYCRNMTN